MSLDVGLAWVQLATTSALLAILIYRGVYRRLPFFCAYLGYEWCNGLAVMTLSYSLSTAAYLRIYLASLIFDTLLEFAVLWELGRVVLLFSRARAPRRWMLLLLLSVATLLVWSLAAWSAPQDTSKLYQLYVHWRQGSAILQVAILLAIAWWNRMQALHWPDEALQVAAGIGFYSIVELAVNIAHTRQSYGMAYQYLDQAAALCYLGTVSYWVLTFSSKGDKRRKIAAQI